MAITDYRYWPAEADDPYESVATEIGQSKVHNEFLDVICERLAEWMVTVPREAPDGISPYWSNRFIPVIDALALVYFLVEHRPTEYVEVGSGNSTKFVRNAIDFFGLTTKIISVDPCPRAEIDSLCWKCIRAPLESCAGEVLARLTSSSLLFVDGSHRSFPGSDVTIFFLRMVPRLPVGMIWGLHDIFLPFDYPEAWLRTRPRFYNEQYLLGSYLLGGHRFDRVRFAAQCAYRGGPMPESILLTGEAAENDRCSTFWMQRIDR